MEKTGILKTARSLAKEFIKFVNASPSPFHVVGKINFLVFVGFGKFLI
jgi:aspartyl aminopeptidase